MSRNQPGLLVLCPARLPAQFLNVKFDPLPRSFNRALQRGIELLDLLAELPQQLRDLSLVAVKVFRQGVGDRPAFHFVPQALRSRPNRLEEHTSELQSRSDLVCRLL